MVASAASVVMEGVLVIGAGSSGLVVGRDADVRLQGAVIRGVTGAGVHLSGGQVQLQDVWLTDILPEALMSPEGQRVWVGEGLAVAQEGEVAIARSVVSDMHRSGILVSASPQLSVEGIAASVCEGTASEAWVCTSDAEGVERCAREGAFAIDDWACAWMGQDLVCDHEESGPDQQPPSPLPEARLPDACDEEVSRILSTPSLQGLVEGVSIEPSIVAILGEGGTLGSRIGELQEGASRRLQRIPWSCSSQGVGATCAWRTDSALGRFADTPTGFLGVGWECASVDGARQCTRETLSALAQDGAPDLGSRIQVGQSMLAERTRLAQELGAQLAVPTQVLTLPTTLGAGVSTGDVLRADGSLDGQLVLGPEGIERVP